MADLSTVKNREKLKPQREPYWQRLAEGQFLGFRPSKLGKGGSWTARAYDPDSRGYRHHSLGAFSNLPLNEHYSAASAAAREWFVHLESGGSHEIVTVREACEKYAKGRPDAERRFQRYVYADPIAKVKLHKLAERHVREWRQRLEALPAVASRPKGKQPVTRARAVATLNRDMVPFRAALNAAQSDGYVLSNRAWLNALKPGASNGKRNLYLDKSQRRELLKHLPPDAKAFVEGLCLLPLRPGALAKLKVADFDVRRKELVVPFDKAGAGRKIFLPDNVRELLERQAKLKFPTAHLFTRADGSEWVKDAWKKPIKKAAIAAELPVGTTAYTLRHSTITDLVQSGIALLTVAQLSGTSARMIEEHYGHLQQEQATKALEALAL